MAKRCDNCGGTLTPMGAGKFKCNFCKNEVYIEDAPSTNTQGQGANVFDKNMCGVIEFACKCKEGWACGSGILIDMCGYALTNTHVVTNEDYLPCSEIQAKIAGETVKARVIYLGDDRGGYGNGIDLALVELERVPRGAMVIGIDDFSRVRIGEPIYVVGNSLGYGTCITSGIVSDRKRLVDGQMLMMTDSAVNGGNSGGPVFNTAGNVIGLIVSGIDNAEGMNFAIPSDDVLEFVRQVARAKKLSIRI